MKHVYTLLSAVFIMALFTGNLHGQCTETHMGDGTFSAFTGNLGQSFEACATGTLSTIEVITTNTTQSGSLSIYSGAGIGGTLLGTIADISGASWVSAAGFSDWSVIDVSSLGISITSGSTYTFDFSGISDVFANPGTNPYPRGQIYSGGGAVSTGDMAFQADIVVAAGDTTAPVFENATPNAASVGGNSFTLNTDIDEAGDIFYVVLADGATAPTSTEVVNGTGSGGAAVVTSGNITVSTGGFTNAFNVTGLSSETAHDVYVVARDDEGTPNLQASPTKIDVTTTDITAPSFENSTPSASSIGGTSFTLNTDINEAGTIFYVILLDGATAPTSTEVVNGTGSGGASSVTSDIASVTTGGFTNAFSITGLNSETAYDVYVVARDDEGPANLQASPTLLNVTTADITAPTLSGVTMVSNNTNTAAATSGDVVTLSFTASETLGATPTVNMFINGTSVVGGVNVNTGSAPNYTATFTVDGTGSVVGTDIDDQGTVTFTIDFADTSGNTGTRVTTLSSGSAVVVDFTAPTFNSAGSTPNDDATDVSASDNIVLDFSENITNGTGNITLKLVGGSNVEQFDVSTATATTSPASGAIGISGDKVYINPTGILTGSTSYAIQIDASAINDTSGNSFAGISDDVTFNFTTGVASLLIGAWDFSNSAGSLAGSPVPSYPEFTDVPVSGILKATPDGANDAGVNLTAEIDLTGFSNPGTADATVNNTISTRTTNNLLDNVSTVSVLGQDEAMEITLDVGVGRQMYDLVITYASKSSGAAIDWTGPNGFNQSVSTTSSVFITNTVSTILPGEANAQQSVSITAVFLDPWTIDNLQIYGKLRVTPDTTAPTIGSVSLAPDNSYVDVTFDEGVFNTNTGSGALETSDFNLSLSGGDATSPTVTSVTTTGGAGLSGGETTVRVNFSVTGSPNGLETVEVDLASNAVFDAAGNAATADQTSNNTATFSDVYAPQILEVGVVETNGTYGIGSMLQVFVQYDEAVTVLGTPQITLETGTTDQVINYDSTSSSTIYFNYTVQAGDETSDLDVVDANSLNLNGGSIRDAAGNDAAIVLPVGASTGGSISNGKDIVIDGVAPSGYAVSIDQSPINASNANAVSFTITGAENATINYTFTSDGGAGSVSNSAPLASIPTPTENIDLSSLPDGTITLSVTLTDIAGNTGAPATDTETKDTSIRFSVDDPSVAEGISGSTTLTFTVSLDNPAPAGGATVDYATADGTAVAGTDYTTSSGTLSFLAGETSKTVDITVSGDATVELDETITLTLSNPTGTAVVIGDASGTGTITNDDTAAVTIADITVNENTGTAEITLTLDNAVDGGFSVGAISTNGTANSLDDYTALVGLPTNFDGTAGEQETVTISIIDDATVEANETIIISMNNLVVSTVDANDINVTDTAIVTIESDDTATVTIDDVIVSEDTGIASIVLSLDNAVEGGFSVDVSTADGTATTADSDYVAVNAATENFVGIAGESQIVDIVIGVDTQSELDETFSVSMSGLTAPTAIISDIDITDGATVTILDDDAPAVISVQVPADGNYGIGENLDFVVTFSNDVTITGIPFIPLTVGSSNVQADLVGTVTSSNTATFRYTVASGDLDSDGVALGSAIDLNGGTIQDGTATDALLALNSVGSTANVNADGIVPTVVVSSAVTSPINTTFTATFTFSEPVMNWDLTDINITNGIASVFNQNSTTEFTALITPVTDGDVTVNVLAGTVQDLAGNDIITSNDLVITYDETRPSLTISSSASDPTNLNPIPVTFTFSEDIVVIEADDFDLVNATISNFTMVSNSIYTADIIPIADGLVTISIDDDTVQDTAGNSNLPAAFNIDYDGTAPTVVVSSTAADPINGAFDVTITFSEDIVGFEESEVTITNGTSSNFTASDSEATLTVTPTADGTVTVSVAADVAADLASNGNLASNIFEIEFDGTSPTVTITSPVADPTNTAFTATFTFSEDVTGFTIDDIEVENGTASAFVSLGASIYTALITPEDDGTVTIDIAEDVAEDAATNGNEAADQFSVEYDFTRPTVEITTTASDPTNMAFDITIAFEENVTDFELSDLVIVNATASNFSGSGTIYTATITPTADGSVTIEIPENVAIDAATNGNEASDLFDITFDGTIPVPVITTSAPDPTNTAFNVTITFTETVFDFTMDDLDVGNGTASNFAGSGLVYTATITPDADGGVTVIIPADVTIDAAGNGNDISNELFIEFDATNPEVTLTTTAPSPVNEPFTVDIVFTENVFGFIMADLVVSNGTPSDFTGSGATYSVTITPTGAGDVVIDVPAAVSEDLATNPNNAGTFTIEFDNIPPQAPNITSISEYTCSGDVSQTGDNTLEISGTAERGSTVEMFIDGISIGTIVADENTGFFTFDYTGTTLADGTYVFTAQATDIATNTGALSAPFTITVNTVDSDGDGNPDFCDDDDNGNGAADDEEDCDGDGIVDSQDSDNSSCREPITETRSYGFSPNGDGVNDGWVIENITAFPNNVVSVYSRSGKLVFRQNNYQNDWQAVSNQLNGNSLGNRLPVGPYIFVIDLGDGSSPTRGWLYINY